MACLATLAFAVVVHRKFRKAIEGADSIHRDVGWRPIISQKPSRPAELPDSYPLSEMDGHGGRLL